MNERDQEEQNLLEQLFASEGLLFLGVAKVPVPLDWEGREQAIQGYRRWLEEGHHGTMAFLERHEPGKYDPHWTLEGTEAVLVAALSYHQGRPEPGPSTGMVARYAWGRDYHKVLGNALKRVAQQLDARWPGHRWRSFTDTAPLDERHWAVRAGGAFQARNTLAVHRQLGSWFLLGEILTSRSFSSREAQPHSQGTCPSGCRRCSQICPTGALDGTGKLDARRCVSYLTIEHRGPIDDDLKSGLGSWVFGCDLCQETCPLNLKARPTKEPQFLAWKAGPELDLGPLLELDSTEFTNRFGGSPVHRAGRNGLVRNACIVAANRGRAELFTLVQALLTDPDPGVQDAARWATQRMSTEESL